VFATGRIRPDGAGFHIRRTIKRGFDTIFTGFYEHLSGRITDGYCTNIDLLLFFGNYYFFSVWHIMPPFMQIRI
jgi:hypothetical protein